MNYSRLAPFIEINLATLLISTAAVLAKLINLPAAYLICLRCAIACFFLFAISLFFKSSFHIKKRKHLAFFLLSGALLAAHWITYFYAIQTSTVAIAVITLFTFPMITALLEPFFFKTPFEKRNIIFSVMIVIGIVILVPEANFKNQNFVGAGLGLVSAILYSIRNLLSKKYAAIYSGNTMMLYQLLMAFAVSLPLAYYYYEPMSDSDFYYLIFLGLVSTAIGHVLFVGSFRHFSTSSASIFSSLTPVYAIFYAYIMIGETPAMEVLIGGFMILSIVIVHNLINLKK